MDKQAILADIQQQISEQFGGKVDVHYKEGKGALFVPVGAALVPQNVIYQVSEMQLILMSGRF